MARLIPRNSGLWLGLLAGLTSSALAETRHPVITKVEIQFSMVSHYCHIWDRVQFYNEHGSPQGNANYAVPHLVYEPLVTLYNPYNEPLDQGAPSRHAQRAHLRPPVQGCNCYPVSSPSRGRDPAISAITFNPGL